MERRSRQRAVILFPEWLNWRVLVGALVAGLALICLSLAIFWGLRQPNSSAALVTAVLNVIPASTLTLPPTISSDSATLEALPSPVPGEISLNAYVQITGTEGTGLRLRSEPGLNADVQLIGSEAEVFIVKDGPREVDGYTWWYLVGPFDESRSGWAVANYLFTVQGP
jgi:hypothetical protein